MHLTMQHQSDRSSGHHLSIDDLNHKTYKEIQTLHGLDSNATAREESDRWLYREFPRQANCWKTIDAFLRAEEGKLGHESIFFASNMLAQKCRKQLNEVPCDKHHQLLQMTIEHVMKYAELSNRDHQYRNVLEQLCLSLVFILMQRTDWPNSVTECIKRFDSPNHAFALLNILKCWPEEIRRWRIPTSSRVRRSAQKIIEDHSLEVLQVLQKYFESAGNAVQLQHEVLKCFRAWVWELKAVANVLILNSKLAQFSFDALKSQVLFQEAAECVKLMIQLQRHPNQNDYNRNNGDIDEYDKLLRDYETTFAFIKPRVLALRQLYDEMNVIPNYNNNNNNNHNNSSSKPSSQTNCKTSDEAGEDAVLEETNAEVCMGVATILTEFGYKYANWALDTQDQDAQALLGHLYAISCHREARIGTIPHLFWGRLCAPFLRHVRELPGRDRHLYLCDAFDRNWESWAQPFVTQFFPKLVDTCVVNCKLPSDWGELTREEQRDFLEYRWRASDLIVDLSNILGNIEVTTQFYNRLHAYVGQIYEWGAQNPQCTKDFLKHFPNAWIEVEAILYCVSQLHPHEVRCNRDHCMYKIFEIMVKIPFEHQQIHLMSLRVLQRHITFLNVSDPMFEQLFKLIVDMMKVNSNLVKDGMDAIRNICDKYTRRIRSFPIVSQNFGCLPDNFVEALFQFYNDSFGIYIHSQMNLIKALCNILSFSRNYEVQKKGLELLIKRPAQDLKNLLNEANNGVSSQNDSNNSYLRRSDQYSNNELYKATARIAIIFKYFNPFNYDDSDRDDNDHDGPYDAYDNQWDYNNNNTNTNNNINDNNNNRQRNNDRSGSNNKIDVAARDKSCSLLLDMAAFLYGDLKKCMIMHKNNDIVMEKLSRCFKHAIKRNKQAFQTCSFCIELLELCTTLYLECPRSSFLYLITIYVGEYGGINDDKLQEMLHLVLYKITEKTFNTLTSEEMFENEPDIVEDYFELLSTYVKRNPSYLVYSSHQYLNNLISRANGLSSAFDVNNGCNGGNAARNLMDFDLCKENILLFAFVRGLKGLFVGHRKASQGVYTYFVEFLGLRRHRAAHSQDMADYPGFAVSTIRSVFGQELVMQICRGLTKHRVSSSITTEMADVFEELYRLDRRCLKDFLQKSLDRIDVADSLEDPSKTEFIESYFERDPEKDRDEQSRRRRHALEDLFLASERYHDRLSF